MSKRLALLSVCVLAMFSVLGLAGCKELASSLTQGVAPLGLQGQTQASTSSKVATRSDSTSDPARPGAFPHKYAVLGKTGLVLQDEVVGTGHAARPGDMVTINYAGQLSDGKKIDSSPADKPLVFTLAASQVIPGLDQGVVGMMVGGKRKVTVPPDLGYGAKGGLGGTVPPNATLVYEVELLKIN